jgi:predicted TPR repeat methyltransferase
MVAAKYWDDAHDQPRAMANLQHALALWPHDAGVFERLGQILRQNGHCDAAIPVFTAGLREDSSATSLRAKLIECLIVAHDWDSATKTADEGAALGQDEFTSMQARVQRMRMDH